MRSGLLRWTTVATSCVGAVMAIPLLHAVGLSGTALVVAGTVVFAATFTGHDVLHRRGREDLGAFLRRSLTRNLAITSACAVGACLLAPIPRETDPDGSHRKVRGEGRVAPPAEGSREG